MTGVDLAKPRGLAHAALVVGRDLNGHWYAYPVMGKSSEGIVLLSARDAQHSELCTRCAEREGLTNGTAICRQSQHVS